MDTRCVNMQSATNAHMRAHIQTHTSRRTGRGHVDEGVVDQHQFVEVELVSEPLAFGLVEDSLVVVVPGGKTIKQT